MIVWSGHTHWLRLLVYASETENTVEMSQESDDYGQASHSFTFPQDAHAGPGLIHWAPRAVSPEVKR
jgi:hypothetical protein